MLARAIAYTASCGWHSVCAGRNDADSVNNSLPSLVATTCQAACLTHVAQLPISLPCLRHCTLRLPERPATDTAPQRQLSQPTRKRLTRTKATPEANNRTVPGSGIGCGNGELRIIEARRLRSPPPPMNSIGEFGLQKTKPRLSEPPTMPANFSWLPGGGIMYELIESSPLTPLPVSTNVPMLSALPRRPTPKALMLVIPVHSEWT